MKRRIKPGTRPLHVKCGPTGLVVYATEAAAEAELAKLRAAREAGDLRRRETRVKPCWGCGGFHIRTGRPS